MAWLGDLGGEPWTLLLCGLAVVVGAVVQGVLGFGLALLAVPVLAWLAPQTVPVGILVAVMPLVVVSALRERAHVDLRGIGWALVGRVPGGAAGAVAVALLPVRGLQLLVAATVGLAVVAAVLADGRRPPPAPADGPADPGSAASAGTAASAASAASAGSAGSAGEDGVRSLRRTTLVLAGVLSGVGGTTSGIGGPPMAVAYRNSGGPAIRSTLATFFAVGALLSLGSLAVVGEVDGPRLVAGLTLVPFVVVGYLASGWLRRRVSPVALRAAVLVLSGLSAVVLLVVALRP